MLTAFGLTTRVLHFTHDGCACFAVANRQNHAGGMESIRSETPLFELMMSSIILSLPSALLQFSTFIPLRSNYNNNHF